MFSIKTKCLIEICTSLSTLTTELVAANYELEETQNSLKSLSDLDAVLERLKRQEQNVDAQVQRWEQLVRVLDKVINTYLHYENKICDNAEQELTYTIQRTTGSNQLDNVVGLLGNTPFID